MCNPSSWCQHAISELSLLVHNTTFFTSQIAWDNFISNKKQPFLMLTIRTYVWHNGIFWFLWGIWRTIVYTLFQLSLKNYIYREPHCISQSPNCKPIMICLPWHFCVYEVQSVVMGIYQDNPNGLVVNSWSLPAAWPVDREQFGMQANGPNLVY